MAQSQIKRVRNGVYQIRLSEREREVLRELPGELIKLLESGDDDRSIFRLYPPGYTDDLGRQVEYDRLMRDDLQARHVEALRVFEATTDAKELDEGQINAWLKALNQLRLVLGTRLDITDDMDSTGIAADDPRASAVALYSYLETLQHAVVEALLEDLD